MGASILGVYNIWETAGSTERSKQGDRERDGGHKRFQE